MVLAMMLPEKRDAILARADDYAYSRLICGVHYPTDLKRAQIRGLCHDRHHRERSSIPEGIRARKGRDAPRSRLLASALIADHVTGVYNTPVTVTPCAY